MKADLHFEERTCSNGSCGRNSTRPAEGTNVEDSEEPHYENYDLDENWISDARRTDDYDTIDTYPKHKDPKYKQENSVRKEKLGSTIEGKIKVNY